MNQNPVNKQNKKQQTEQYDILTIFQALGTRQTSSNLLRVSVLSNNNVSLQNSTMIQRSVMKSYQEPEIIQSTSIILQDDYKIDFIQQEENSKIDFKEGNIHDVMVSKLGRKQVELSNQKVKIQDKKKEKQIKNILLLSGMINLGDRQKLTTEANMLEAIFALCDDPKPMQNLSMSDSIKLPQMSRKVNPLVQFQNKMKKSSVALNAIRKIQKKQTGIRQTNSQILEESDVANLQDLGDLNLQSVKYDKDDKTQKQKYKFHFQEFQNKTKIDNNSKINNIIGDNHQNKQKNKPIQKNLSIQQQQSILDTSQIINNPIFQQQQPSFSHFISVRYPLIEPIQIKKHYSSIKVNEKQQVKINKKNTIQNEEKKQLLDMIRMIKSADKYPNIPLNLGDKHYQQEYIQQARTEFNYENNKKTLTKMEQEIQPRCKSTYENQCKPWDALKEVVWKLEELENNYMIRINGKNIKQLCEDDRLSENSSYHRLAEQLTKKIVIQLIPNNSIPEQNSQGFIKRQQIDYQIDPKQNQDNGVSRVQVRYTQQSQPRMIKRHSNNKSRKKQRNLSQPSLLNQTSQKQTKINMPQNNDKKHIRKSSQQCQTPKLNLSNKMHKKKNQKKFQTNNINKQYGPQSSSQQNDNNYRNQLQQQENQRQTNSNYKKKKYVVSLLKRVKDLEVKINQIKEEREESMRKSDSVRIEERKVMSSDEKRMDNNIVDNGIANRKISQVIDSPIFHTFNRVKKQLKLNFNTVQYNRLDDITANQQEKFPPLQPKIVQSQQTPPQISKSQQQKNPPSLSNLPLKQKSLIQQKSSSNQSSSKNITNNLIKTNTNLEQQLISLKQKVNKLQAKIQQTNTQNQTSHILINHKNPSISKLIQYQEGSYSYFQQQQQSSVEERKKYNMHNNNVQSHVFKQYEGDKYGNSTTKRRYQQDQGMYKQKMHEEESKQFIRSGNIPLVSNTIQFQSRKYNNEDPYEDHMYQQSEGGRMSEGSLSNKLKRNSSKRREQMGKIVSRHTNNVQNREKQHKQPQSTRTISSEKKLIDKKNLQQLLKNPSSSSNSNYNRPSLNSQPFHQTQSKKTLINSDAFNKALQFKDTSHKIKYQQQLQKQQNRNKILDYFDELVQDQQPLQQKSQFIKPRRINSDKQKAFENNFSTKMLEFNTENQKIDLENLMSKQNSPQSRYIMMNNIDTEDKSSSINKQKNNLNQNDNFQKYLDYNDQNVTKINDYQQFQQLLPSFPQIPSPPTLQHSQQQLFQLGKYTFQLFGVNDLNRSDISLNVKKFKNCVYFGIDSSKNILWHYDGKIYFGGWKNNSIGEGEKSGEGIQYAYGKYIFQGQFNQGKRNGKGILKLFNKQNSSIYVGQFVDNKKQGRGKIIQQNGNIYEGEWYDNRKHGYGVFKNLSGQMYDGTFKNGEQSGFGMEYFKNGDIYKGDYQENKFEGKGVYIWKNGSIYEGQFSKGRRNGQGIWKSSQNSNAQIYQGEYQNDKKNGFGIYRWPNGSYYQGHFLDDKKHGIGKTSYQNGKQAILQWQNGKSMKKLSQRQWQQSFDHRKSLNPVNNSKTINSQSKQKSLNSQHQHQNISSFSSSKKSLPSFKNIRRYDHKVYDQEYEQDRPNDFTNSSKKISLLLNSKSKTPSKILGKTQKMTLGGEQLKQAAYQPVGATINIFNL